MLPERRGPQGERSLLQAEDPNSGDAPLQLWDTTINFAFWLETVISIGRRLAIIIYHQILKVASPTGHRLNSWLKAMPTMQGTTRLPMTTYRTSFFTSSISDEQNSSTPFVIASNQLILISPLLVLCTLGIWWEIGRSIMSHRLWRRGLLLVDPTSSSSYFPSKLVNTESKSSFEVLRIISSRC